MFQDPWRTTRQIGRRPAANLHHAMRFAARSGRPLNQLVTINFARAGCPALLVSLRFRRLLAQRFAPWLRRATKGRGAPTYVWVVEAPGAGAHVHWAVHVPPALTADFRRRLPRWVADAAGIEIGAIEAGSIEAGALEAAAIDHRPIDNAVGLKRYLLKGMDPYFAGRWQIRAVPQGLVIGRRVGVSRNLARGARRAGGYRAGWRGGA